MDQNKYAERVKIYQAALHCEKPERVPTLSNAWGWKILDCDDKPTFEEATSNWEIMEKVVREHFERYSFDSASEVGFRFNSSYKAVLGRLRHESEANGQALDTAAMTEDGYTGMMEQGPDLYQWTTIFPNMFGDITFGQLQELIARFGAFGAFVGKMYQAMVEEYSMPILAPFAIQTVFEDLFNYYRGIKNLSTDMRRRSEQVLALTEKELPNTLAAVAQADAAPHDLTAYCTPFLAPTVLNSKQFEKFYWPTFKKMVKQTEDANSSAYLFVEGETSRFADYFNEFKAGTLLVHVEQDDMNIVRTKLPHTCLAGGMPVSLLNEGTKEECVAFAKKLCDDLGGSGYVFSQNKMMSYANDGKRENLLAVQGFVTNYAI